MCCWATGVGLLINRNQPHEAHQTTDTMPSACVVVALHMTCHSLTGRVLPQAMSREVGAIHTTVSPRTACPLSSILRIDCRAVDDLHELQVLGALALRLIVQIGSRQRQQCTLPTHAQLMIFAHHFLPRVPRPSGGARHPLPGSACLHAREGPKNPAPPQAGQSWNATCRCQPRLPVLALLNWDADAQDVIRPLLQAVDQMEEE